MSNDETENLQTTAPVDGDETKNASDTDVAASSVSSDAGETAEGAEASAAGETAEAVGETAGETAPSESAEPKKQKQAQKQKAEKQKPQKQRKPSDAARNRKIFKYVYYPVLAVLFVVMFVLSVVDGMYGGSPNAYNETYYTAVNGHIKELSSVSRSAMLSDSDGLNYARDYIVSALEEGGFAVADEVKTERDDTAEEREPVDTVTDWSKFDEVKRPTVTVQTSALEDSLQADAGLSDYLVGATVHNIVAAIPSRKDNAGAVIITVRYDARPDASGAASGASFVANALQTLVEYGKSGKTFARDLVVVFTEDLDKAYGSYAFFGSFKGLDDVVSRAECGINLDACGNGGTLAVTDSSKADFSYLYDCANLGGSGLASSVVKDSLPSALINADAVAAFGDIPALQISVVGGLDAAQSADDNADNLSQAVVHKQSEFIKNYIEYFADGSESYTAAGGDNTVFFSYLGDNAVVYTSVAAYVFGALILALIAGAIVALVFKKTFSLKNMFVALGVQLLVAISSFAAMLAAYFLVTLMLTGFGVLPIHAITMLRYFNAGIFIAALLIATASSFGFTTLYKKLFRVTSSDSVRGTAMLFGFVGAIMCFVCPEYSFLTSWLGLLLPAVLLVTTLLHKPFKAKFGFGMDRLYLFAVPAIFCLPLTVTQIVAIGGMLPLVLFPALMLLFVGMLGVAVPYLDRTQPLLDKVAKKLPKRTIRVQRTVTEKVEDRAKKGKFTEQTFVRVEKEKIPVNYKNYFGISVVAVLGVIVALFSGGFGATFGQTIDGFRPYNEAIYGDSLVYEIDMDENTQTVVVGDLMTYKFARYYVSGLEWSGERGCYVKSVSYTRGDIIYRDPQITKGDSDSESGVYSYTVSTFDGALSSVTLTIPSARDITRITVKESNKTSGDYEGYVYDFENEDTIVLRLPYGFDTEFTLDIEGGEPTRIEYEEHRPVAQSDNVLDSVDEWNDIKNRSEMSSLRGGIVIKRTVSL